MSAPEFPPRPAEHPTSSHAIDPGSDPGSTALDRSNPLLLAALEATADGILVVDLEGRTVVHNSRFLEMWGIPADYMSRGRDEELRGYVADQLADPQEFAARVAELYADLDACSDDTIRLKDGRVFERFSQPQRLDGRVVGRVWSFRDATARFRAEEELRTRERQLAETQRLARLGSWRWDVPENRVTWSDELYRIYGLDPTTFGATFEAYLDRVHPDDVDAVRSTLQAGLATGGRLDFEERIIRPDGEVRVLRSLCKVMLDEAGRPLRVVGACHDITEQRAAEAARAASEASYRAIFDASTDAVYVIDPKNGSLLDVNRRACELHGRTRDEILAIGLAAVDTGEEPFTREAAADRIRAAVAGASELFEWQAPHVDGHRTWVEVGLRKVVIGGEERLLANCRDITDRKNAELALQADNEVLELRVAERTLELAETNLMLEEEVAERTRTEEELLRTASELEAIFQAMPDGYLRLDAHGIVLDHRPGVVGTGLPARENLEGCCIADLPGNASAQLQQAVASVRRTGELVRIEYSVDTADGCRDLEARLVPFAGDQAIAVVRDVTEARQSARELQRSEEHFRTLIENGSDLIIVVSDDGRTTYLSPSAERLLGYPPEQRLGRSSFDMIHPDDVPAVAARRQEAIDNPGVPFPIDFRYRHGDGRWRTFEAFVRTLRADSAAGGLVVNARDVTSRKAIEAELKRSEQYFRTLIENASDLITIVDADGTISYESAAITRLFGYGQDELIGRNAFELMHPDDAAAVVREFGELVATPGVARSVEFRFRAKDGTWRVLESVGRTVNPESAADGVVVNSRDIAERRAAQEALEKAMADAERANRAKSEFLSRMSHELRTPMNSILGFAQLLARRATDDDQARSIDHILKAGRHLLNLINEVLDISRIEAKREHLSLEPVRIDGAVHEAITLIRPMAAQYDCVVEDPDPLPDGYVMADRQRLAQVLLNLLSNAVKYNRPGGRVRVTVKPIAGETDAAVPSAWRIDVHDTGPGIPANRMNELFVPFSRLGADHSDVEGTGLGLALSQRLVEAMGGSLEARSVVGEGSTFSARLDGAASPLDRPATRAAIESPRRAPASARPATLLYIEDNLANLTLVETILDGRPDITLVPALQGRLGVDLARQHNPDLILLDLHLPDIPGDEVLARLRDDRATRRIPVVVISADATPRRIARLRQEGVFAYLTKPLDVDEFLDTVDAVLEQREE
jgi:PAS domain S-box-containing protein